MRRAVIVAVLAVLAFSCKSSRKNVLVRVLDVPEGVVALEVSFTLDGDPAMSPFRFEAPAGGFQPTTTFVVVLPDDAAGELGVAVVALDVDGCRIGEGTGFIPLPAETMTIGLGQFPPMCSTIDAAIPDAGPCADCANPPLLRSPRNGASTGSVHASGGQPVLRPELRWEPVTNADTFRVQLDDSCTLPFDGCAFPSPEVDVVVSGTTTRFRPASDLPAALAVAPVGARYFWRVQVCDRDDVCSPWSQIRYLEVGRQPGDFNGDGYADSIMGSHGQDSGTSLDVGTSWVLYGSAAPATSPQQNLPTPAPQIGGVFGAWVASIGDINADGFGDAAVAAALQDQTAMDEGVIYLFLGGPAGLTVPAAAQIAAPDHVATAAFGSRMAGAGDVNGDGYADFAVAAIGSQDLPAEADEGDVYIFHGGPTPPLMPVRRINNPLPAQPGAMFGVTLGMRGDLNGDGYADLAAGATNSSQGATGEGALFVFYGSPTGLAAAPVTIDSPGNQAGAAFGTAAALGDVNGDGFDDLLAGAEGYDGTGIDQGVAFVFYGARGGVPVNPSLVIDAPGSPPGALFGDEITAADVNGDGFLDAVIAAPEFSGVAARVGEAYLYVGGSAGLDPVPWVVLPAPYVQADARFALHMVTPGDVDGDGFADVVESAPFADFSGMDSGMTHLYLGSPIGLDPTPSREYGSPLPQVGGYFGSSVACRETDR